MNRNVCWFDLLKGKKEFSSLMTLKLDFMKAKSFWRSQPHRNFVFFWVVAFFFLRFLFNFWFASHSLLSRFKNYWHKVNLMSYSWVYLEERQFLREGGEANMGHTAESVGTAVVEKVLPPCEIIENIYTAISDSIIMFSLTIWSASMPTTLQRSNAASHLSRDSSSKRRATRIIAFLPQ